MNGSALNTLRQNKQQLIMNECPALCKVWLKWRSIHSNKKNKWVENDENHDTINPCIDRIDLTQ